MLNRIINLSKEAGKILSEGYNKQDCLISYKGKVDLVTETDLKCEKFIADYIKRNFPEDTVLAEENNSITGTNNRVWIIDPLDGTTNFSHKYPFFAVSIALQIDGEIRFGAVFNPVLNELFYAEKGKGAFLNDKKISVSSTKDISKSLIATGFPYDRWENGDLYLEEMKKFVKQCLGVRREGSAAIDLCYVACGRLDGYFERKLKPWDMAAGQLIVLEAGGKISTYENDTWNINSHSIIADNQKIHKIIIDLLSS
ncbi:MAG: inositol monophosphatase [Candidatus Cloacimonadota bacterium]|nr:MAG: inositol monophosphatase [Candidatus Cloacimonadota bacterium]